MALFRNPSLILSLSPSILTAKMPETSSSVCSVTPHPKLSKTLLPFAKDHNKLTAWNSPSKAASSTESFPNSWSKAVTSPEETALEADRSGEKDSLTKTSSSSTNHSAYQWPTLEKTPMEVSSSLPPSKLHGLTTATWCLEQSRKAEKS